MVLFWRPGILAVWLALALLVSGGCATRYQPMGAPVAAPHWDADSVIAADGYRLPIRRWGPAEAPQAVLLALHGFNDYSLAFEEPATHWAEDGILTYAFDQRGFGATADAGIWADTETLVADVRTVAQLLRTRHPDVPLVILGESMGGAVALVAGASDDPPPADRYVLLAPGVIDLDSLSGPAHSLLWLAENGLGGVTARGEGVVGRPTDDRATLQALWQDPLVIKDTRADAMAGLVRLLDAAFESVDRFDAPALVLFGRNEEVVPPAGQRRVIEGLPDASTRLAVYPNGFHLLLRDVLRLMPTADIARFVIAPDGPLATSAAVADRQQALERLELLGEGS